MRKFEERMIPEEEINKTAPESGDLNLENPLAENQDEDSEKIIKELKLIAQEVSKTINELNLTMDEIGAEEEKNFLIRIKEEDKSGNDLTEEEWGAINEYENEEIDWKHGIGNFQDNARYGSLELNRLIEAIKALYGEFRLPQIIDDQPDENDGKYRPTTKEMNENLERARKEDEKKYKPFVEKLEKFLKFQINLEQKLEQIVYGEESASLPKEFTASLPREIAEIGPERLPDNTPLYFPVGISKELPEWKKVFEYGKKAAKPIDLYGYMFWLENQGRPVELVVCDEIQATNYAALYPDYFDRNQNSLSDFGNLARKIGEREKENYQKIINAFGLKNIKMVDYREFVDRNKDQFEKYRGLCEGLAKNPIFAESFLSMVQESVAQSMTREEKEKFLPYAIEEVS